MLPSLCSSAKSTQPKGVPIRIAGSPKYRVLRLGRPLDTGGVPSPKTSFATYNPEVVTFKAFCTPDAEVGATLTSTWKSWFTVVSATPSTVDATDVEFTVTNAVAVSDAVRPWSSATLMTAVGATYSFPSTGLSVSELPASPDKGIADAGS